MEQVSSCVCMCVCGGVGGRAKQLDSRYILRAKLIRGWTRGVSEERSHEDTDFGLSVRLFS